MDRTEVGGEVWDAERASCSNSGVVLESVTVATVGEEQTPPAVRVCNDRRRKLRDISSSQGLFFGPLGTFLQIQSAIRTTTASAPEISNLSVSGTRVATRSVS